MNKEINFRDDLFFLYRQIKLLRLLRNLQVDHRFYEAKAIVDIQFIEQRMIQLYQLLTESNILLERLEHLQLLSLVTRSFLTLLEPPPEGGDTLEEMLLPHAKKLGVMKKNIRNVSEQVQSIIEKNISGNDQENFVSEAELEMLLRDPSAHE